mmetsp:Transcript_6313/g.7259  ORF Transcript_6313/g.7259 Transcript_6313/m.7259 type:complete len:80 (-) Transcript_6313:267-506(-)
MDFRHLRLQVTVALVLHTWLQQHSTVYILSPLWLISAREQSVTVHVVDTKEHETPSQLSYSHTKMRKRNLSINNEYHRG